MYHNTNKKLLSLTFRCQRLIYQIGFYAWATPFFPYNVPQTMSCSNVGKSSANNIAQNRKVSMMHGAHLQVGLVKSKGKIIPVLN